MAAFTGNYRLGPDAGRVVVKTSRAGLAAKVGHDLVLEVTRWSADINVPAETDGGMSAAAITAELDLGSLAVRDGTGGARPLTDADRRDIQSTMGKILGGAGQAAFRSTRVIPAAAGGAIDGTLTLNGRSQPVRLQMISPAAGRYRGTVAVVQSAFGIKPYTGFFGALKLRDEVTAEFEVDLSRAVRQEPTEPAGLVRDDGPRNLRRSKVSAVP
jgi:polyisoprenoid-binding protein YceI